MAKLRGIDSMANIKNRILNLIEKYENEEAAINERIREFSSRKYFHRDEGFLVS